MENLQNNQNFKNKENLNDITPRETKIADKEKSNASYSAPPKGLLAGRLTLYLYSARVPQ